MQLSQLFQVLDLVHLSSQLSFTPVEALLAITSSNFEILTFTMCVRARARVCVYVYVNRLVIFSESIICILYNVFEILNYKAKKVFSQ